MTQTPDSDRHSEDAVLRIRLREQLLLDGESHCLPMSHVNSVIARALPGGPTPARHALILSVVRSLLDDGLVVVGDIVGASDERVEPWDLSIDEAMARIIDSYVVHHDENEWVFTIWLALTDTGQRVAEQLRVPST